MKERIEKLRRTEWSFDPRSLGEFFNELVDIIGDLALRVEEFEPEEITMDDVNAYYIEEDRDLLYRSKQTQTLLQEGIERDKLAKELVEAILGHSGWITPGVMDLAVKLKEKLDDK